MGAQRSESDQVDDHIRWILDPKLIRPQVTRGRRRGLSPLSSENLVAPHSRGMFLGFVTPTPGKRY